MVSEKSLANLRPIKKGQRTKEEQIEFARKGGNASKKAKAAKKSMMESLDAIMQMPATGKTKELLKKLGVAEEEQINAIAIAATIFSKGMGGDQKALEMLLDYSLKVSENERKNKEAYARIEALKKNGVDVSVNSGDQDDGGVVIYLPKIEETEE